MLILRQVRVSLLLLVLMGFLCSEGIRRKRPRQTNHIGNGKTSLFKIIRIKPIQEAALTESTDLKKPKFHRRGKTKNLYLPPPPPTSSQSSIPLPLDGVSETPIIVIKPAITGYIPNEVKKSTSLRTMSSTHPTNKTKKLLPQEANVIQLEDKVSTVSTLIPTMKIKTHTKNYSKEKSSRSEIESIEKTTKASSLLHRIPNTTDDRTTATIDNDNDGNSPIIRISRISDRTPKGLLRSRKTTTLTSHKTQGSTTLKTKNDDVLEDHLMEMSIRNRKLNDFQSVFILKPRRRHGGKTKKEKKNFS